MTHKQLLHMLSESYVEYMRAVWKLNTAFKHFTTIYKAVFPNDITASSTVSSIINDLNSRHEAAVLTRAVQEATLKEQAQSSSSTVKSMFYCACQSALSGRSTCHSCEEQIEFPQ
jgi:hypothetical protein